MCDGRLKLQAFVSAGLPCLFWARALASPVSRWDSVRQIGTLTLGHLPSIARDSVLETAYNGLQTLNEQLQDVENEICRLTVAKSIYFPQRSASSNLILFEYERCKRQGFGGREPFKSDWWKSIARTDLIESVDNLDRALDIMNASRSKIGNLPNEILLLIFERVEDCDLDSPFLEYQTAGRKDIQYTRLVCRRFNEVSSQLLIRLVRVDLNEPSLARLDEISRHPTIAKGVRVVRVVLHFYNSLFADLDWFLSYYADELEEQVDVLRRTKPWTYTNLTKQTCLKLVADGRTVVSRLRRLSSANLGNPDGPDDSDGSDNPDNPDGGGYSESHTKDDVDDQALVHATHREYLILLEKQELLIKSGKFSRAVGSAVARMPGARKLEFNDTDFGAQGMGEQRLMMSGGDIWVALHRLMLQPLTGYTAVKRGLDLPNYQCVLNVVDAVRRAGTFVNGIDISLSTLGCPGSLMPAPDIRQTFSSSMQQLKKFTFDCGAVIDQQDADDLNKFLSACLDTSSLQEVQFDMRSERGVNMATIDVGKVMGSRPRHNLTNFVLGRVDIDLPQLVRLLERLPQSMSCLHLKNVGLLSGTWKEALDTLRKKSCPVLLFRSPQGGECDDMSREDYERIFGNETNLGYNSEAELYIRNRQTGNPVQKLEEGFYAAD